MKTIIIFFTILVITPSYCKPFWGKKSSISNQYSSSPKPFALIELFTSEGCSSCPPADELIAKFLKSQRENVYLMSFHVDYWNNLGWKDRFSSPLYTRRQNQYANAFHLTSIYTPQVVVNGTSEFTGSDKKKLYEATSKELTINNEKEIFTTIKITGKNKITVKYKLRGNGKESLNVALLQKEGQTQVKGGENGGRTLNHVHIVRVFKTISKPGKEGEIEFTLPNDLSIKDILLISFLQETNLKITAASQNSIP